LLSDEIFRVLANSFAIAWTREIPIGTI